MSVFGFSTAPSEGNADIVPVLKYDARAGRLFRVDRVQDANGWTRNDEDITSTFKALVDLENVETGWLHFPPGSAPQFTLVPIGSAIPPRPTPDHKNGIRFMLKLAKECGGDVREISGSSKAFLAGVEALYTVYAAGKAENAGKLPVVALERTVPIKSGNGATSSTNYSPVFKIVGWAPRGDLVFKSKASGSAPVIPPTTGATVVPPPAAKVLETSDFG